MQEYGSLNVKKCMLPFFSGSTRSNRKEHQSVVPCVHRKPSFFMILWDWEVSKMPLLNGCLDSSNDVVFMKLLYGERDLVAMIL
jgi:hypothetical protein